jgi:ComF family protein
LGLAGFDAAYTYGSYEGTLRKLIHLFKYERMEPLARSLAAWMVQTLPRNERFDVIVPMPLHWRRKFARGFNQSEALAEEIGRRLNVRVRRAVRRVKATPPQAGLTNAGRRASVQSAFAMRRGFSVQGQRVLIIDDVFTTGATAGACARVLKRAGAKYVAVAAVARTDRRLTIPRETFLAAGAAV